MNKKLSNLLLIALTALVSCKKSGTSDDGSNVNPVNPVTYNGFAFNTAKDITLNLSLKSTNGDALKGVVVSIYNPANTSADAAIYKAVTDQNGNINAKISVPTSLTKIVIDPSYLGLMRLATANINNNTVTALIGGASGYSGDIVPEALATAPPASQGGLSTFATGSSILFSYPAPYTSSADAVMNTSQYPTSYGVPNYLEATSDVIDASLLSYVNASLPESKPLTTTHPDYLSSSAVSTLNIVAKSDVWITFVAEGAGNLNSLAFYTYPTGNPPTSESDIKKATMVFPNASGLGSGGGLKPGNKVKIGTFDAGTSIGFILLGNGWTGSGVNTGATKYYSDNALNPESTTALKKHSVVLYDDVHKLTLIGFEDLNRQGSSDNDFNDLVFYASSNPVTAISNVGVSPIDKANDTDGDGVIDALDAFPNDATRAFISYFPSQTGYASVAFEDNWPIKGDYDLNDLIVNYRYTFVTNAQNKVVTIQGDYNIAAAGASFKNGFGVQLPIAASAVQSVTGQQFKDSYIQLASNGVEAGQTKAVIIPFDNSEVLITNPGNALYVNTLSNLDKVTSKTASVLVTLTSPIDQASLTASLLNPFLISNERRGFEVHLPGYAPTDKVDKTLFGTNDDASVPAQGKYYFSKENLPWAIAFNSQFIYPLETVKITDAYPHFAAWAASGGISFTDWYSNIANDYRVNSNLYLK